MATNLFVGRVKSHNVCWLDAGDDDSMSYHWVHNNNYVRWER
jgi:hypothetical protein